MNITWLSFTELEQIRHEHSIRQALKRTSIKRKVSDEHLIKLFQAANHEAVTEQSRKDKFQRESEKAQCSRCKRFVPFVNGNIISHRKQKNGRGGWCINNNAVDNEPIEVHIDSQK